MDCIEQPNEKITLTITLTHYHPFATFNETFELDRQPTAKDLGKKINSIVQTTLENQCSKTDKAFFLKSISYS
jgi:hypothetical protein